jgi:hypothetical protein
MKPTANQFNFVLIYISEKISFEAHTTDAQGHFPVGKVLIFPIVSVNDGQGYNSKTGIFTAPVAGMYQFTMHFCSAPSQSMVVALMRGKEEIAVTTVSTEPHSGCGSHSTIARVKKTNLFTWYHVGAQAVFIQTNIVGLLSVVFLCINIDVYKNNTVR